jgi:hypothetical protein
MVYVERVWQFLEQVSRFYYIDVVVDMVTVAHMITALVNLLVSRFHFINVLIGLSSLFKRI